MTDGVSENTKGNFEKIWNSVYHIQTVDNQRQNRVERKQWKVIPYLQRNKGNNFIKFSLRNHVKKERVKYLKYWKEKLSL